MAGNVETSRLDLAPGGRPPVTTRAELAAVAVRLFRDGGFDATTVDDIAAVAGVSRRTFFRYFPTKSSVLWNDFDQHIDTMGRILASAAADQPIMDAIRHAVLQANRYRGADLIDLRHRIAMIATVPALQASATLHYAAWQGVISDFVAARTGLPGRSLYPQVVARATLAACRAAYETWAEDGRSLRSHLDRALLMLAQGFQLEPPTPRARERGVRGQGRR